MPSTATRGRPRSTGSSVKVAGPGQVRQMLGGTAAGKEQAVVEGLKRATSAEAVAQEIEVAGGPRRATSAAGVEGIMPWAVPEEGEVSVLPVTGARRAGALHPAAQEVSAAAGVPEVAVEVGDEAAVAAEVADAGND